MATYPIRQLADNGGTAQFVPVTAPEAVQFPDGSNLNTFIGSVATIESNPVAANHAVGEFLCVNGQVYDVIDAITAGDFIALGENVQVTNLGSQITALNNDLTWKYFSQITGANHIDISSIDFDEILISVQINGSSGNREIFQIPKVVLTSSNSWFRAGGYKNTGDNALVTVGAKLNDVWLVGASLSGTDYTSGTVMQVFYR